MGNDAVRLHAVQTQCPCRSCRELTLLVHRTGLDPPRGVLGHAGLRSQRCRYPPTDPSQCLLVIERVSTIHQLAALFIAGGSRNCIPLVDSKVRLFLTLVLLARFRWPATEGKYSATLDTSRRRLSRFRSQKERKTVKDGIAGLTTGQRQTVTLTNPASQICRSDYLMKQEPSTSDWLSCQPCTINNQQSTVPSCTILQGAKR